MQTELTRPYFPIWFVHGCNFALPRLGGGVEGSFWEGATTLGLRGLFVRVPVPRWHTSYLPKHSSLPSCCRGRGRGLLCWWCSWLGEGVRWECALRSLPQDVQPPPCVPRSQRPTLFCLEKRWPGSWWAAPNARRGCTSTPTVWSPKVKGNELC